MARRRLKVQTVMLVMAVLVLGLGAACVWVVIQNARPPAPEAAGARVVRQVREQRGAAVEVRYSEAGRGRALCGYIGARGGADPTGTGPVAFVSRPNRILFADDPLPAEFRDMQQRFCPGFLVNPARPVP